MSEYEKYQLQWSFCPREGHERKEGLLLVLALVAMFLSPRGAREKRKWFTLKPIAEPFLSPRRA